MRTLGGTLWPEDDTADAAVLVPAEDFDALASAALAHIEYQTDPIGWASDKLGIPEHTIRWSLNAGYSAHAWDGDIDPLAMLADALRDWKSVGCESGTGTGKSFAMAWLILWFLACWEGARVFTFAPKEDQLRLYIWTEIGKLWPRFKTLFPTAELTDLCIRMRGGTDDSWGARGYAVGISADEQVSTKAAGMHAEHMLLVYEETPGIPMPVLEAGENTCTAPHNLRVAIGNPNHRLDPLHTFCTSAGVVHVRMSALDHPNVVTGRDALIPGAVSPISIARRLQKYGESSPVYQSRVRGVSPEQATDALIRWSWLEAAADRYHARQTAGTLPRGVTGKGVDVANSEHGDRACVVDFAANACVRIEAFACPDSNALGRQVKHEIDAARLDPQRVGVDAIGVGAGTVNELRHLGAVVRALNASARPMVMAEKVDGQSVEWSYDVNKFKNLRSQMYWQVREDLRLGTIDVPEDRELWEELVTPTFVDEPFTIVEAKDDVRARLGRSPDKADAFVMANWVRARDVRPKPERQPPSKEAHRARPIVIKGGKVQPPEREPRNVEELVAWAQRHQHRERVPRPTRERVPRW